MNANSETSIKSPIKIDNMNKKSPIATKKRIFIVPIHTVENNPTALNTNERNLNCEP